MMKHCVDSRYVTICMPSQYPYRDMDGSKVVLHLIHITINTLNAQYHSCRPHATAGPLYSDNSNMSRYSEKEKGGLKQMWREKVTIQVLRCGLCIFFRVSAWALSRSPGFLGQSKDTYENVNVPSL